MKKAAHRAPYSIRSHSAGMRHPVAAGGERELTR